MSTLQEFSDALANAVETAGQNVVRIEARRRLPATGIVWSEDLIVTAHHVVERDENIRVGLPDGTSAPAELVGRDPSTDLAVLRVKTGLSGFTKADGLPRVGHLVVAVGRPGSAVQASVGIVSAIGANEPTQQEEDRPHRRERGDRGEHGGGRGAKWERSERAERGEFRWGGHRGGFSFQYSRGSGGVMRDGAIQSDVVMYPGFSGGPLVDASGRLLGMNTSAVASGSSLSIPLSAIARVVDQLSTHGKIRRGFLGASLQPMRLTENLANMVGQSSGLLIVATEPSGPAENGGLYQGDIVVALDGQRTRTLDELLALLNGDRVGTSVPVRIVRGGQTQDVNVTIGERH
jgi:S1-C subfamily serine protease